jgi:uncharacterized membrane protein YheB (UPF0754 family)
LALEANKGDTTNQNDSNGNRDSVTPLSAAYWHEVHEKLCPFLEAAGESELIDRLRRLAQILETVRIEEQIPDRPEASEAAPR